MPRVRPLVQLVHWKTEELDVREAALRAAGYRVQSESANGMEAVRSVRKLNPVAVVIDLSRLPSHGRETALTLRQQKATRHVPIVFMDGATEKVAAIRAAIPGAEYSDWKGVGSALRRAIHRGTDDSSVPERAPVSPAGYSGTPLPRKLGIKANHTVVLLGAPENFAETLGTLPPGVTFRTSARASGDLLVAFVRTLPGLRKAVATLSARDDNAPAWIAWPKKTSALAGAVTEREVRQLGLAAGMVDYKICAIDATWSGLLFSRKRKT